MGGTATALVMSSGLHGQWSARVSSILTTPCPLVSRALLIHARVARPSPARRVASDNLFDTARPRLSRVSSSADRLTTSSRHAAS